MSLKVLIKLIGISNVLPIRNSMTNGIILLAEPAMMPRSPRNLGNYETWLLLSISPKPQNGCSHGDVIEGLSTGALACISTHM